MTVLNVFNVNTVQRERVQTCVATCMQPCSRRKWTCPFTLEQCPFLDRRFGRCTHTIVCRFMNDNALTKVSISRIETSKEKGEVEDDRTEKKKTDKKGKRKNEKKGTTMKHISHVHALSFEAFGLRVSQLNFQRETRDTQPHMQRARRAVPTWKFASVVIFRNLPWIWQDSTCDVGAIIFPSRECLLVHSAIFPSNS